MALDTEMYCPHCGSVDIPDRESKGNWLMGALLLLLFCVPGVLYAIWTTTNVRILCSACHREGVILLHSPRAREALRTRADS